MKNNLRIIYFFIVFIVLFPSVSYTDGNIDSTPKKIKEVESKVKDIEKRLLKQELDDIRSNVKNISEKIKGEKTKDIWDKLGKISPLISGFIVALIGAYATSVFNKQKNISEEKKAKQELKILEVQTVEGFLPHLASDDPASVKAALYAIEALGNKELTIKLGELFGGNGALEALLTINEQRHGDKSASKAIANILKSKQVSIVTTINTEGELGTGFFINKRGLLMTTLFSLNDKEEIDIKTQDGEIYQAKLINHDKKQQLAYLQVNNINTTPLPLADSDVSELGEQVAIIGKSQRSELETQIGSISSRSVSDDVSIYGVSMLVTTKDMMRTYKGYAGAPVFNSRGSVIGMINALDIETNELKLVSFEKSNFKT